MFAICKLRAEEIILLLVQVPITSCVHMVSYLLTFLCYVFHMCAC